MRVLDNLENYDIPSGFHLTAEQEEQLAADLKEIVLALIPLRSSKLNKDMLISLSTIVYHIQNEQITKANEELAKIAYKSKTN